MSGFAGSPGKPGPQGPAGTISIATTVVGPPGSDPSVRNIGGESEAILEFTLSTGATGDQGPIGPQPLFGTPDAISLPAGSSATAAISGDGTTQSPYILSLGIPVGAQGEQGETGPDGPAGPQPVFGSPIASTLPAGSSATVSISGAGTAASPYILTLGIPAGQQGAQGDRPVFGSPTATTLEPGQAATASISGLGTAASPYILALGIPKGSKGDTGATGEPGSLTAARDPTSADGTAVGQMFTNTATNAVFVLTALNPKTWQKVCYGAASIIPTDNGYTTGAQVNSMLAHEIPLVQKGTDQFIDGSNVTLTDFGVRVGYGGYAILDILIGWTPPSGAGQKISLNAVKTSGGADTYYALGTFQNQGVDQTTNDKVSVVVPVKANDVINVTVTRWASGGLTVKQGSSTTMAGVVIPAYVSGTRGPMYDWGSPTPLCQPPASEER